MNALSAKSFLPRLLALCLVLAGIAWATDPPGVRAVLQAPGERTPAPEFALQDSLGKTMSLSKYRGKVVVVDFWATWCTGCKKEIPWFSEFQKKYGAQGFAVVGISLDEGGWKVLKPFLTEHKVPYRMLLGDDATARRFGITNMPDTFLIDRQGNVAAAYRGGLVDRDDAEANIRAVVSEH